MGAILQNSLYWGSLYQGLSVHLKMCIRVDCIRSSKAKKLRSKKRRYKIEFFFKTRNIFNIFRESTSDNSEDDIDNFVNQYLEESDARNSFLNHQPLSKISSKILQNPDEIQPKILLENTYKEIELTVPPPSKTTTIISPGNDMSNEFDPKYEISSKGAYRLILGNSFFYDLEGDSQVKI